MTRHRVLTACGSVLLLVTAGCQEDEAPAANVELSEHGACGDAYVWLATASGDQVVTLQVDALDRSAERPTAIRFSVPDPDVRVRILRGDDMTKNLCTDVIDQASQPSDARDAVAGQGSMTLSPAVEAAVACGEAEVTLVLDDLEAEDGTTFAPVHVRSTGIGCYSG